MLQAVLFDMDGVIVDTEPLHHKAYYKMFADLGLEISAAEYQSYTGQSTINVCKQLAENHSVSSKAPEEMVQMKRNHFKGLFAKDPSLKLLDGVLDLIKNYYANGITLVLASSASMGTIDAVFDRFDLNKYFIAKLSGADLKESKPHPEIFLKAAQTSGKNPKHCMVIEDSTNGIKAAHSAGIFCAAFRSPHSKNQNYDLANIVIDDFDTIRFENSATFFNN